MRVIARRTLREFWERGHPEAEQPLRAWFAEVDLADWQSMSDIKASFPRASIVDSERVVFDIGGNRYRLVAKLWLPGRAVYVKFVGTHADCDRIDVAAL